ncbi:hypothetical protein SteCoe_2617 [Stentor coeruleus]|uniref:Peptidase C1A papain C-terminal domain-containing protein n=1 Tax=Stentor coeruleus TaxID=5963 RepID=A0A1R2CZ51_9CILI|nr:hypothetical protein SteCoe_2617 [Stentor coeruleus]
MKFIVPFLLLISCSISLSVESEDDLIVFSQEDIDYVNSVQTSWTAGHTWVSKLKLKEAKGMMIDLRTSETNNIDYVEENTSLKDIPSSFLSNVTWPGCMTPIQNQGVCSASYAFASTAVMGERACIINSRYAGVMYSAQNAMACSTATMKCSGGTVSEVYTWIQQNGVCLTSCQSWTGSTTCNPLCDNGSPLSLFTIKDVVNYQTASAIQTAIMTDGPVASSMTVYQDFSSYTSGIYTYVRGGVVGAQSVKMFGWGTNGSVNYWVCSNSWGTSWGMQGYFLIQFGQCKIEQLGESAIAIARPA